MIRPTFHLVARFSAPPVYNGDASRLMMDDDDALRMAELEQDNRRLRRLLDQRDAPGELRHRLRTTLALLRSLIRKSAETGRDLASYVAHLEDRLDAIVRAHLVADQHGEVDLRTLVADELFQYGAVEGEKLMLGGPDIRLRPRSGQLIALAIHELAVNAVEHGPLGLDEGWVEVTWSTTAADPDKMVVLTWNEHGPSLEVALNPGGFGTEVLHRMLAYELGAEVTSEFEPDGHRCTVLFALPDRVGRLG